ncbi:methyltransferase [Mitsuokella jalaludinii]|uniref:methyltransferase n=1 Tax=Mitsuokella jalaludinii TaxID=187979 RepID=UPI00307BC318
MERREIVHNAYAVVGQLSKGYDGMMKNESLLGRLANRFFWQLRGPRYESFVRQAFQGLPEDFSGTLLEVPVGTGVLSLNGLHAFPNKMAAFCETHRVLKKGGTFTGCCYIKGQNRVTDLFVRAFCVPMGFFTPPFDTAESLEERLRSMYREVMVTRTGAFAGFVCRK